MKTIVPINKYIEFLEENHKKLIIYFDELYKEYAQYECYKSHKINKKHRKKLENDRNDAFLVYYANYRHFIRGEDIQLSFIDNKDNWLKRFIKKIFRIKDKEKILIIEESPDTSQTEQINSSNKFILENKEQK